jgi:hypothetical protein
MRRRGVGIGVLLALFAAALVIAALVATTLPGFGQTVRAPAHPARSPAARAAGQILAAVSSTPVGRAMPQGFVGLSLELPALTAYAGTNAAAVDRVFVALVRQLAPGGRPWLRIGGHTTDEAWMPAPGLARRSPALWFRLTARWLRVAHAVASALNAELLLGVNLAADDPALARAEAAAMNTTVGARYIAAFEIGNEPDVYNFYPWYQPRHQPTLFARSRAYGLQAYLTQFARWHKALTPLPVAGPSFASYSWMSHLHQFLRAEPGIAIVTFHQYPLWGCQRNPGAPNFASIHNLLRPSSSSGLARQIAPFAAVAHRAGLLFRLDELNSAACTGRFGVSNTFASALWSLDALFSLAKAGVDGVNIHMLPGAAYAPFELSRRGGRWRASVRPLYYGLLAFVRAFPPGARLLRVRVPDGPVKVWATVAPDDRVRVILINERSSGSAIVHLQLARTSAPLTQQALLAPSLQATRDITLGGESFGASTTTGTLRAARHALPPLLASAPDTYRVVLPPSSALLLTG